MATQQSNITSAKGDCYESSCNTAIHYQLIKEAVEHGKPSDAERQEYQELGLKNEIYVFHGYATPPTESSTGKRVHHAWVEVGDLVLETQSANNRLFSRRNYYGLFSIYPNERYTVLEAHNHAFKTPGYRQNFCAWRGEGQDIC